MSSDARLDTLFARLERYLRESPERRGEEYWQEDALRAVQALRPAIVAALVKYKARATIHKLPGPVVMNSRHKFCALCGSEMVERQVTTGYDRETGLPRKWLYWACEKLQPPYSVKHTPPTPTCSADWAITHDIESIGPR